MKKPPINQSKIKALEKQENKTQERCCLVQEVWCLYNGSSRKKANGKQKEEIIKETIQENFLE